MKNRHLSAAEAEIGIHERPDPVPESAEWAGQRLRRQRPPVAPARAGRELSLKRCAEEGYWLCTVCKAPVVQLLPGELGEHLCGRCLSPRLVWREPIF